MKRLSKEASAASKAEYDAAMSNMLAFITENFPSDEDADVLCREGPDVCNVARLILSIAIVLTEMPHLFLDSFKDKQSMRESQIDAWRRVYDWYTWHVAGKVVSTEHLENLTDWAVLHLWGCAISIISLARKHTQPRKMKETE